MLNILLLFWIFCCCFGYFFVVLNILLLLTLQVCFILLVNMKLFDFERVIV